MCEKIKNYNTKAHFINTKRAVKSNTRIEGCGVPQSSILRPILFIHYIDRLQEHVKQKMILFATESCVVNNGLSATVNWLQLRNLVANLDKT